MMSPAHDIEPEPLIDQTPAELAEYPDEDALKFDGRRPEFSMLMVSERLRWSFSTIGRSSRTCVTKAIIQLEAANDPLAGGADARRIRPPA
jgi:hypothetical protein